MREPGIVSRAKRRRERGSDGLSRGFIVELKKPIMAANVLLDSGGGRKVM